MKKLINNWQQKSLEILADQSWGDPSTAQTSLVKRCIALSKVSIDSFSLGDLRLMIGQEFGLQYLVPLAIEKLQDNIFVDATYKAMKNAQVHSLNTLKKYKLRKVFIIFTVITHAYNSVFAKDASLSIN